eukprot:CAMPEP_0198488248 /NCGR_PEP_ID=MMETSP1462-20131121/626_1 /TAXON_ID=1333877 /ORGANISM="Brandtodinium nutriculum, Strain RCC3387" /LENGTH=237 /DNA_ID=CAMNT_0044216703 /DNA_START=1 /DNA_END=710 /DNA_ORIENTATION=-
MPPIPGGVEALRQMAQEPGVHVCICTAPFGTGDDAAKCKAEKKAWVRRHLGEEWLTSDRFVCQKDKTTVPGALLIDDKPAPEIVKGVPGSPSWQHVVFTQPFNREDVACAGKARIDEWSQWRNVVLPLLARPGRPVGGVIRTVLVDMDGVLCDFERHFLGRWRAAHPEREWIPPEARRSHAMDHDPRGVYDQASMHAIVKRPGFFESMPPIPGGVEALRQMVKEPGLHVCICTAPFG